MNKDIDISNVVLQTKRLTLRAFKEEDLNDMFEYASVDGVGEKAGWAHHQNIDETRKVLTDFIQNKRVLAIVYKNKVIGSVGIERYDEDVLPEFKDLQGREIGYVLSKSYWGQGLMPEAVKEVIKYLFEVVKLDFIICSHATSNIQSYIVQEKCGFSHYKQCDVQTQLGETRRSWYSILRR